jgi:hypothetical protein
LGGIGDGLDGRWFRWFGGGLSGLGGGLGGPGGALGRLERGVGGLGSALGAPTLLILADAKDVMSKSLLHVEAEPRRPARTIQKSCF